MSAHTREPHPIELEYAKGVRSFHGADLRGANLSYTYLRSADLRGANLSNADLRGANLRGADLGNADLSGANLSNANLSNADLSGADLRGVNLRGVNLYNANLSNANLRGANLANAQLSTSRGLNYAQCSFTGHGECGRQLTLVEINNELVFFCGCFRGTESDLRLYIEGGLPEYRESRLAAMNFLLSVVEFW